MYNICHGMYECVCTYIHTYIYILHYIHIHTAYLYVCSNIREYIVHHYPIFFPNQKACHVANILSRLKAWVSGEGANSFPRSPQVGHLHRLIFVSIAWIFVDLWTSHQHVINCSSTFHNQKPLPLIESNLCLGVLGDLGQLS